MYFQGKIVKTFLIFVILLSSCGYRFSGRANELPSHIKAVAIPIFINSTQEPLIESVITNKVIQEFIGDGRLKVVDSSKADAVLKGRIYAFSLAPLSFDRGDNVLEYRVVIQCELVLEDVKENKIIWKEPALTQSADYKVSSDISATRTAKEKAIEEASKRFASDLVARVFEGF